MKIENDDLWQRIKEGELKGLSIEGYFVDKLEKMGKQYTDEEIQTAYKELQAEGKINKIELGAIDDLIKADKEARKLIDTLTKEEALVNKKYYEIQKESKTYNKLNKNYRKTVKKGKEVFKKLSKEIEEVEKGAKALGIQPDTITEFIKATNALGVIRAKSNDAYNYPDIDL